MKRIIRIVVFILAMFTSLSGCAAGSNGGDIQDIPLYSPGSTPMPNVPYYEDLQGENGASFNAPYYILTIERAKALFQSLGFKEYQMTPPDSNALPIYRSITRNTGLEIEDDGNGIVSAVRLDVDSADTNTALAAVFSFISCAIGHDLSDEYKSIISQIFTAMSQDNDSSVFNEEYVEIDGITFILFIDFENGRFIVNW